MNDVQKRLAALKEKGWTLAAIADELEITVNAVVKWQAGDRTPSNHKSTLEHLDRLLQQRRVLVMPHLARVGWQCYIDPISNNKGRVHQHTARGATRNSAELA